MKNVFGCLVVAVLAMVLSGCANERYLDLGEKALDVIPEDIGRFSAHLGTRRAEEKTKQEAIKAAKESEDADRKEDSQNVITNIDTDIKALAAANIEQSKTMRKIVKYLANKLGGKNEFELATTKAPKGVVAETLDSAGNAFAKVADTPAALATSIGVTAVKISKAAIKEAGDDTSTGDNSPVTVTKTTTTSKTEATNTAAEGSATGSAGNQQNTDILPAPPLEEGALGPVAATTE